MSRLERVARERGITLIDPTDAFRAAWRAAEPRDDRGQPLFFPNDGHWTARGHEVAALAMLADLAW